MPVRRSCRQKSRGSWCSSQARGYIRCLKSAIANSRILVAWNLPPVYECSQQICLLLGAFQGRSQLGPQKQQYFPGHHCWRRHWSSCCYRYDEKAMEAMEDFANMTLVSSELGTMSSSSNKYTKPVKSVQKVRWLPMPPGNLGLIGLLIRIMGSINMIKNSRRRWQHNNEIGIAPLMPPMPSVWASAHYIA